MFLPLGSAERGALQLKKSWPAFGLGNFPAPTLAEAGSKGHHQPMGTQPILPCRKITDQPSL
jgi:hypothetical protein